MDFRGSWVVRVLLVAGALVPAVGDPTAARAVSCTTQSQMKDADRSALESAALGLAQLVQKGDVAGVKARTAAPVAAQFDGIAAGIQATAALIPNAVLTTTHLFLLDAADLKQAEDLQFFCGIGGSPLSVVLNLRQLPPGRFAMAILHATGVAQPQQMALILEQEAGQWKLAGFYARPLTAVGHDGVWYWTRAREYGKKKQDWNAYFYYMTARNLLSPVDFMGSPNLDKLEKEQGVVQPEGLPGEKPMTLTESSRQWNITGLGTDASLGGLDLVIHHKTQGISDPVSARSESVALMKAMLAKYPELREGFHGLWVYAEAANQSPYAVELPMNQIQ